MPVSWGSWGAGETQEEAPAEQKPTTPKKKKTTSKKIKIKTEPGLEEAKVGKIERVRVKKEPGVSHKFVSHRAGELLPSSCHRRMARRATVKRMSLKLIAPVANARLDAEMSKLILASLHHMRFCKRKTLTTADTNIDNHVIFS